MVLGGAALLFVILILAGSEDGEVARKSLQAAPAVAVFAPLVAAGIWLARRRAEWGLLAHLGTAAAVIGFAIVVESIWSNDFPFDDWRPAGYALLISIAVGQISVLLALAEPNEGNVLRLLRGVTVAAVVVLAVLGISEMSSSDIGAKETAVPAVVFGIGTIALLFAGVLLGRNVPLRSATQPQLDHVGVPVDAWDHSGAFYRDILGTEARPAHADLSFAWDGSAASAIEHLHRHGVAVLGPPTPREGARGPAQSIYFRDPSGRLIELIAYG